LPDQYAFVFTTCSCCSHTTQDVSAELADEVLAASSLRAGFVSRCVGQIIAHYETVYPPFKRHRLAQIGNVLMNVSYDSMCHCRDLRTRDFTAGSIDQKRTCGYSATVSPHPWGQEPDTSDTTCFQHGCRPNQRERRCQDVHDQRYVRLWIFLFVEWLTSWLFRWSRLHQCRTNDCFCLQPSFSPIPVAFARSAIRTATPKRHSRGIYFPSVGSFGGPIG
jgi:hypothetical protein